MTFSPFAGEKTSASAERCTFTSGDLGAETFLLLEARLLLLNPSRFETAFFASLNLSATVFSDFDGLCGVFAFLRFVAEFFVVVSSGRLILAVAPFVL